MGISRVGTISGRASSRSVLKLPGFPTQKEMLCMRMTITGRKCTPRESFKDRAEVKLAKIERFFGEDAEAKITATVEKSTKIVEITVKYDGMIFRAERTSPDSLEDALDDCIDALIRRIRKNKTKVARQIHSGSLVEMFDPEISGEEETEFDLVRRKSVYLRPQSLDEAILQMNMLGHAFYMFLNAETEQVNVVYRRKDGTYGLIEPEE